ncbi:DUF3322 domain-containing protein [Acidithiobacillus sp. IBUN Pt1247-S3]|uniref:DUF3322 domain-containing protein n=1 Tax=Acidithiobacillus sp. IBUN Pt1247-S3 TaxID=3166642 RepID=UPI0034E47FCE
MNWTRPADVKAQVQRLWDRGVLLAAVADGEDALFPLRLPIKGPNSRELSERFSEVRDWISALSAAAIHYRIEWRTVNHRVLGSNEIPSAIWIDQPTDALLFIGKRRAAEQFSQLLEQTRVQQPALLPWLRKRPLHALELAEDWPSLLEVIQWLQDHPRPGIYLRQLDLPGIHSKWLESHRAVLAELLDRALPEDAIDSTHVGIGGFCQRYGFQDKPTRVRFRILDIGLRMFPGTEDQDITLTAPAFAALSLSVDTVFITENEINFLTFPAFPRAIVIFGAGYGFENLAAARWLHDKHVYYWGDLDTHGFAILDQLRKTVPQTVSFLMDEHTLLAHRSLWGKETKPETATLNRLNAMELTLYEQLRDKHWGEGVRLEQERIGFDYLRNFLTEITL